VNSDDSGFVFLANSGIGNSDSVDCQTSREEARIPEFHLVDGHRDLDSTGNDGRELTIAQRIEEEDPAISANRTERFRSVKVETEFQLMPSFELWNADRLRSIESVVMFDGQRSVREVLLASPPPSASELSVLVGEGILREGVRCLDGPSDSDNGRKMLSELKYCCDIGSMLRLYATFYTRATFLYRRVNKFMRETSNIDEETGRNLGLYIGILRECFCVRSELNPLEWRMPQTLYRCANFPIGVIVDYARRQNEKIWWQGFTSTSSDINEARKFRGNVLFEIALTGFAPSLSECSAFPHEHEFIVNPYQQFTLDGVGWSDSSGRWIIQVGAISSPDPISWFSAAHNAAPV
jgi:hypothetical protein